MKPPGTKSADWFYGHNIDIEVYMYVGGLKVKVGEEVHLHFHGDGRKKNPWQAQLAIYYDLTTGSQ